MAVQVERVGGGLCNFALRASGWSGHPDRFTSGKDAIPSVDENVDSTGFRTTSRPARNESLRRQYFHSG